jgi:hypothetical protein
MHFVALGWARVGWAMARQGQTLNGIRYLESAWKLSQSPAVADRLGQVYQQAGRASEAKRWFALAAADGNKDSEQSLQKLDPAGAAKALQAAKAELVSARTVKLPRVSAKTVSAEFNVVFDGTEKPERAEFVTGDEGLRTAVDALVNAIYPVAFPDESSIKIVRRVTVSCVAAGCSATLMPIDAVEPAVRVSPVQAVEKATSAAANK